MVDSITIANGAVSNVVVEDEYAKAIEMIKGGKTLSESLMEREYMLPLIPQMAGIGEESGKIDEMLGKAAKVYEDELYHQIENISTMIEPILMVIMAGLIGVVVGGTLLPIYSLVNSVSAWYFQTQAVYLKYEEKKRFYSFGISISFGYRRYYFLDGVYCIA